MGEGECMSLIVNRVSCMSCDNDGVIVDGSGLNGMYGVLMWIWENGMMNR